MADGSNAHGEGRDDAPGPLASHATEDFSGLAYLGFSMAQLADRSVKGNGTALIGSSITVDVSNPAAFLCASS
jgi:hypothetical protein